MSESTEPAPPAPEPESEPRRRKLRWWLVGLAIGAVAWVAGGLALLSWQPGRFTQIAMILVPGALAAVVPGSVLRRILSVVCVVVLLVGMLYGPSALLTSEVEFTVRGTGRGQGGLFLIHTDYGANADDEPGETFRNQDAPLSWKVDSSDWQGVLETLVGRRVRARVIGVRVADASVYRNILFVEAEGG